MPILRTARILALVLVAGIAVAGALAWIAYRQPLALPQTPFAFEVKPRVAFGTVARELGAAGLLPHPELLIAMARLTGTDRSIKAGSYELAAPLTMRELLAKLTEGDVMQGGLIIVEGTTFADLRRALRDHPMVARQAIDLPAAQLAPLVGAQGDSLEGLFFPDTYYFAAGTTDVAILKRAKRTLDDKLAAAWARRSPDLPLASPYEALILASIVEKETGRSADRPLIASVLVNRLKAGMRLQADPTVIYGLGARFDGNLRKRDLEADSPYNTYVRDGLPPTPIAMVSQASLDATLAPPKTTYLYFVARGDGTSEFTSSLADHNRAVARYQKGGK